MLWLADAAQERPELAEARNLIVSAASARLEATEGKRGGWSRAAALVMCAQPGSDTAQPSPWLGVYGLLSLLCTLLFPTFPSFLGHDSVI